MPIRAAKTGAHSLKFSYALRFVLLVPILSFCAGDVVTSNGFDCANPAPQGISLCPLFYHLPACNLHRKVIIRTLMQLASTAQWLAFIPLTTHSRSEDSVFAASISRHIDKSGAVMA